jgi:hypothetical protein
MMMRSSLVMAPGPIRQRASRPWSCILDASFAPERQSSPRSPINLTHVDEPTNGTSNALREFLDGDRVVRWGLVPSHDLAAPFAVSGPLMLHYVSTV